jgi:hypothetical protein
LRSLQGCLDGCQNFVSVWLVSNHGVSALMSPNWGAWRRQFEMI